MARDPIPTWAFALVLVRLGRRILLVQERKHQQLWYLPAGRVEPGETLVDGAKRETLEESGIDVTLDGVVAIDHSPKADGTARLRVIFAGSPTFDTPPRSVPNEHSLGARWVTLEEMTRLPMRGVDAQAIATHVLGGGAIYPMSILRAEHDPW